MATLWLTLLVLLQQFALAIGLISIACVSIAAERTYGKSLGRSLTVAFALFAIFYSVLGWLWLGSAICRTDPSIELCLGENGPSSATD
jgi:hypothetical protein